MAGRATGAGTHRPSTSQWPALPAAETSAGGGCWLSPQTTQFITPFIPHLFTNALATFLSHQQKGGGRIQPHMADLALEHFPWPILGGDYMDRTIYFHEGSGLMVHSSQEGGVDRVGGGRGGRRGSQQPPRWHSLHSNRPHPTHTGSQCSTHCQGPMIQGQFSRENTRCASGCCNDTPAAVAAGSPLILIMTTVPLLLPGLSEQESPNQLLL